MEPVAEVDGVLWVNDSKATNVAAACTALESLDRPVLALLGGRDKGEDFHPLAPLSGVGRGRWSSSGRRADGCRPSSRALS
jgi:UDP-N-acetylmuramoylalanine-D-glutamate ligase